MPYYEEDDELNPLDIADQSVESLLESLSLDVIRGSMEQQISGEINSVRNFLDVVIAKFEVIKNNKVDPEEISTLNNEMIEFAQGLVGKICDKYDLCVDPATDDSMEYLDMLSDLYIFFVINKEDYVTSFVVNYIIQNKKRLVNTMDIGGRGIDITTQAFRKRDLDKYSVSILAKVNDVIDYVKDSVDLSTEEFLQTIDDGDYYVRQLLDYFGSGILCGNFTHAYIKEVIDERSSESALKIRNNIRLALATNNQ